jgi:hypothetical protein
MLKYRICALDAGGTISVGRNFMSRDDEAALDFAGKMMRDGTPAEVWLGGRYVGRPPALPVDAAALETGFSPRRRR